MVSLVMFSSECLEIQTYHLLYLIREDKIKRVNSGTIIMVFKIVDSAVANACNAAKVSYSS